jgi:hypothetical protein
MSSNFTPISLGGTTADVKLLSYSSLARLYITVYLFAVNVTLKYNNIEDIHLRTFQSMENPTPAFFFSLYQITLKTYIYN